jgi:hypothetical protein
MWDYFTTGVGLPFPSTVPGSRSWASPTAERATPLRSRPNRRGPVAAHPRATDGAQGSTARTAI